MSHLSTHPCHPHQIIFHSLTPLTDKTPIAMLLDVLALERAPTRCYERRGISIEQQTNLLSWAPGLGTLDSYAPSAQILR